MQISYVTFENLGVESGRYSHLSDWIEHTASLWEIDVVSRAISAEPRFHHRIRDYHELSLGPADDLGSWIHQPKKVFKLLALLRQIKNHVHSADIVYTDMIFANFYSLVSSPRQCLIMEVNGQIGEELVNKGTVVRGGWKHASFRLLERWGYRRADHLITVSSGLREYLVQEFGVSPARIDVISNGVDLRLFPASENGHEIRQRYALGNKPVIFFHGFFQSWHGLDHLVKCFRLVRNSIPDAYLMLVGDGPSQPAVQQLIQELNLSKSVILTGPQPKPDIHRYIATADVCVYYADYNVGNYGFLGNPIKFYEYMAMQKPIVATRLRGFSEPIEEHQCGLVVPHTYQDFARGVVTLLGDPDEAQALGRNGRQAVESTYNWSAIGRRIYAVCSEALDQKRASHL